MNKKIIYYSASGKGSFDPALGWMRSNMAELDKIPVDGLAFFIGYDYNTAFDSQPHTWNELNTPSLSGINWGHFTDNYLLLYTSTGGKTAPDWYDDNAWSRGSRERRTLCPGGENRRSEGHTLRSEPYGTNPWTYSSSKYGGRSFAQVQAEVRQRGAQWMTALQNQYPDITVYTCFLSSMPMQEFPDGTGLQSHMYALLPAFENGMLDAPRPSVKIVDGNEMAYYVQDTEMYYTFAQFDQRIHRRPT